MTAEPEPEPASLQARWRAFQDLATLRDHWYWRPGWRAGRSFYTWHLTFEDSPELHQLVHRVQETLDVAGLDPVPRDGLHLTMQGVGFVDEVSGKDLDAIINAAAERVAALSPFDIALGPVDPDEEGIGLLVKPWRPVVNLRSAIRDAIGTVWPEVPEADNFRPHVTVAYSNAPAPTAPVRARLAALRDLPPATVHVTSAQLIRLNRDAKVYRWDVHSTIDLKGDS